MGEFSTVDTATVSGLAGEGAGDDVGIDIALYPVGVLRTSGGGDTYVVSNPAGTILRVCREMNETCFATAAAESHRS